MRIQCDNIYKESSLENTALAKKFIQVFPYNLTDPDKLSIKAKCHPFLRLPWQLSGKEYTCQYRRPGFDPWVRTIPWRRKWQPTPVSLPGKLHGQKSLAGCSPWGHKKSDTTAWLNSLV